MEIRPKPDDVDIPDDKDWEEMSAYMRFYYKNGEEEQERSRQRREAIREWYYHEFKPQFECLRCGEDHPACIAFHHGDEHEKDYNLSLLVNQRYASKDKIRSEAEKCIPLCANCHRKEHNGRYN